MHSVIDADIDLVLPQQSYKIAIADNNLKQLGQRMEKLKLGKKVLVVSNQTIFDHYGQVCKEFS